MLALLAATLAVYAPALFGGRVLLPADIVPLMRPWSATASTRFPDFRTAQNQMLGPIFEYYSWRHYARERIHRGEVPLWNPRELGGNVLLANNQSAVLYPPNVLLYVLPLPTGINLVTALHTFLTGLFLFGFLRTLRLRRPAAMTGALVWMFCGLQVAWTEFQTPTAALCWLPGALWAWERYLRTARWRVGILGVGGALAMALLAGHMQFAFYVGFGFAVYAVARAIWPCTGDASLRVRNRAICLVVALVLAGALSASTLLPVLEVGRSNFRGANDYAGSVALRIPPMNLLTIVVPNLLGNPHDYVSVGADGSLVQGHDYIGRFEYVEYAAYVGVCGIILALVGIVFGMRRRGRSAPAALALAMIGAAGLLLAAGTPLCAAFYYGVPGYRQFHATARALCLLCLALAGLAAFGVDRLLEASAGDAVERNRALRTVAWTSVGVAIAALVAFPGMGLLVPTLLTDHWFGYEVAGLMRSLGLVGASALVAVVVVRCAACGGWPGGAARWSLPVVAAVDVLLTMAAFNPVADPAMLGYPTATTDFLATTSPDRVVSLEDPQRGIKSRIVPNMNAVVGYREAQGADSLHWDRYHRLMECVALSMLPGQKQAFADPNTVRLPGVTNRVLDLLNVRYATTHPSAPLHAPGWTRVLDAELTVWRSDHAFGPVWIVGRTRSARSPGEALRLVMDPSVDLHTEAVVEGAVPTMDARAAGGSARVVRFDPHRIAVDTHAVAPGLLVLSEIGMPGWHASVDGRPAQIVLSDYVLRSVPIPAGDHRVELVYRPASYYVGLYLTALALAACVFSLTCRKPTETPK